MRKRCPDWGAGKLAYELEQEQGIEVPRITVHRILKRRGLVRERDSHAAATKRFERSAPNELWQMDFKGMPAPWTNRRMPLSIVDDHSRYVVALECKQDMKTEAVREMVTAVFERAGVPRQMLLDHGAPWWNMQSGIGLTQFSAWLMKQGIQLLCSGYRHPQTQGKVERFPGSLERAMRLRGMPEQSEWQPGWTSIVGSSTSSGRHEALGMKPPARHWQRSRRVRQPEPQPWDYPAGVEVRRLDSKGQLQLAGGRWVVAGALAGERVGLQQVDAVTLVRLLDRRSGKAAMAALPEHFRWHSQPESNHPPVYDVMKQEYLPRDET